VPDGAVRDLADVGDLVTSVGLEPGEVLLAARLVEPGEDRPDLGGVPEGMQEISISLETAQLVAGNLTRGDLVGVMAGYVNPEETVMIKDRVLVMATNVSDLAESAQGSAIITLAVDEATAKKIAHAGQFGRVWLTKQNESTKNQGGVVGRKDVTS
jgi:pilus assembly protein CpaB